MSSAISGFNKKFYTPLHEAALLIQQRYNDPVLRAKVLEYLGQDAVSLIPFIQQQPVAFSFRHVVTPNFEYDRFIKLSESVKLKPLFCEYLTDTFTDNNDVKYALGKCSVYLGIGKNGGEKIERYGLINFNSSRGKPICDVRTIYNTTLVQFHHNLFLRAYPEFKDALFDASPVLALWGGDASRYYKKFLALFICYGVLFETFVPEDLSEAVFLDKVFIPAFNEVTEHFGLKPIIAEVLPTDESSDGFWYFYSPEHFSVPN